MPKFGARRGGAPAQNISFALGVRSAAEEACGKVCHKCRNRREGKNLCQTAAHVRADPKCKMFDSKRWAGATQRTCADVLTNLSQPPKSSLPNPTTSTGAPAPTIVDGPTLEEEASATLRARQNMPQWLKDNGLESDDDEGVNMNHSTGHAVGHVVGQVVGQAVAAVGHAMGQAVAAVGQAVGQAVACTPGEAVACTPGEAVATQPTTATTAATNEVVEVNTESQETVYADQPVVTPSKPLPVAPAAQPAKARTRPHEFISEKFEALKQVLGKGDTIGGVPSCFQSKIYCEILFDEENPCANSFAYHGCKLFLVNWARQRRQTLPNGSVPCAREGCCGTTASLRYGPPIPIARADGLFDYIMGVERQCKTDGTTTYDYDWSVVRRLPNELQLQLSHQPTSATKQAAILFSRDLEHLMQYSFTENLGAGGWETVMERAQSKAYALRLQAWLEKLRGYKAQGIDISQHHFIFPTMKDMGVIHLTDEMIGNKWQDSFTSRGPYKCREMQGVKAEEACSIDVTTREPSKIADWKHAATLTVETGEIADVYPVPTEAHEHKRAWLKGVSGRDKWRTWVSFSDDCPKKSEEIKEDTKSKATGSDNFHDCQTVSSKCNNFNKRFSHVTTGLSDAYMYPEPYDMQRIDTLLLEGKWIGILGGHKLKLGDKLTQEQIDATKLPKVEADKKLSKAPYFTAFKNHVQFLYRPPEVIKKKLEDLRRKILIDELRERDPDLFAEGDDDVVLADLELGLKAGSVFSPDALKAFDRLIKRAHLYVLPDEYKPYRVIGHDRFGLPIYRSNGRGSVFCESAHSAMPSWFTGESYTQLKGVSLMLEGCCSYNMNIRNTTGTSWGNGTLADWWIAEDVVQMCDLLGIHNNYFPNFKAPSPAREASEELGIAGGLGGRLCEFKRKEMKKAEDKVERLAEQNTAKLMLLDGGVGQEPKRRKVSNKPTQPPASHESSHEGAHEESAWQEVKTEPRNPLATLKVAIDTTDIPSLKMSAKSAKQWLQKKRPDIIEECKKCCPTVWAATGPGKRHHAIGCPYQVGIDKLQGK